MLGQGRDKLERGARGKQREVQKRNQNLSYDDHAILLPCITHPCSDSTLTDISSLSDRVPISLLPTPRSTSHHHCLSLHNTTCLSRPVVPMYRVTTLRFPPSLPTSSHASSFSRSKEQVSSSCLHAYPAHPILSPSPPPSSPPPPPSPHPPFPSSVGSSNSFCHLHVKYP